jgi:hypothetical protein
MLHLFHWTKFTKSSSIIETLRARISVLECQLETLTRTIAEEAAAATFAVDFSTLGAFSVERIIKHGVASTVIGYIVREEVHGERTLYCNQYQHEELVKEFKKHLVL